MSYKVTKLSNKPDVNLLEQWIDAPQRTPEQIRALVGQAEKDQALVPKAKKG